VLRRSIIFVSILLNAYSVVCQPLTVKGSFSTDSLKLGEPIRYRLSVKYPRDWQVLLPDSTFDFTPFEFQKKLFFQTRTLNNISTDSVVYQLTTYEIDSILTLGLPAFVVTGKDCTVYESGVDTVFFKHLVAHVPDSVSAEQLPLKTNTGYNPVSWLFNYPIFSLVIGSLIILTLIGWLVFGKKIKKYFLVKRLNRQHQQFLSSFQSAVEKLNAGFSPDLAERSLTLWKKYMEDLLTRPYTKYTTRELRELEKNESLNASLRTIDRSIYGKVKPDSLDPFHRLKEFSQQQFHKKLEEVQHG
jgi:hypothetical protein